MSSKEQQIIMNKFSPKFDQRSILKKTESMICKENFSYSRLNEIKSDLKSQALERT